MSHLLPYWNWKAFRMPWKHSVLLRGEMLLAALDWIWAHTSAFFVSPPSAVKSATNASLPVPLQDTHVRVIKDPPPCLIDEVVTACFGSCFCIDSKHWDSAEKLHNYVIMLYVVVTGTHWNKYCISRVLERKTMYSLKKSYQIFNTSFFFRCSKIFVIFCFSPIHFLYWQGFEDIWCLFKYSYNH